MTGSARISDPRRLVWVVAGTEAKVSLSKLPPSFTVKSSDFESDIVPSAANTEASDDLAALREVLERGDERFDRRLRTASFVIAVTKTLRAIREVAGLSQADLGKRLELTQGRVSQLESFGKNEVEDSESGPSIGLLQRLTYECGYSVEIHLSPIRGADARDVAAEEQAKGKKREVAQYVERMKTNHIKGMARCLARALHRHPKD